MTTNSLARTKIEGDRASFDVDFSGWLPAGDSVASVISIAVETGRNTGEVLGDGHSLAGNIVTLWLKGGTAGETAHVIVIVTTAQGNTRQFSFKVRVRKGC